jgi:hypothetical protein
MSASVINKNSPLALCASCANTFAFPFALPIVVSIVTKLKFGLSLIKSQTSLLVASVD